MWLQHLTLANFRNYRQLDLKLPSGLILVYGDNAQGKTNLLEAIYVLATSRSPHTQTDRQLIHWAAETEPMPYARIAGTVQKADGIHRVELVLLKLPTQGGADRLQKQIKVDGVRRRALDLIGLVPIVLFSPQDIDLVAGSPSARRRYLDATLCQIDPEYCRALAHYTQVLTQRNALLKDLQERRGGREELIFWDDGLVQHGALILERRLHIVETLRQRTCAIHADLTGGQEALDMAYLSSLKETRAGKAPFPIGADGQLPSREAITQLFRAALQARQGEEIARGVTVVGPHRDDLRLTINQVDAQLFGSRGQQRTLALALKLAETEVLRDAAGETPILLLDDVMSELDAARRAYLSARVNQHRQTIITSTDLTDFAPEFVEKARVLNVA
ncbi:MAG: hypothetical protein A2Z04_04980, partial [Chloroflexi bacterium RBG_16_57_9]